MLSIAFVIEITTINIVIIMIFFLVLVVTEQLRTVLWCLKISMNLYHENFYESESVFVTKTKCCFLMDMSFTWFIIQYQLISAILIL